MAAQPRTIVVGYDGSDAAVRALDAAVGLSGYGSALSVVSVGHPVALAEARERLLCRHVSASYLEPAGEPAEELVKTARGLGADLIVVGRRNGSPLRHLLGSTSAKVVRRAHCDVLVVR